MRKILALFVVLAMLGTVSAEMCDVPGSGCNEQDWGSPNCGGGYGGFDGVGCSGVAMVVAPGNCDGSDNWASVDMSDGTVKLVVTSDPTGWGFCAGYGHLGINWISKSGNIINVRYLDGYDDDAFDVYFNDNYVCSVTMLADGKETWETSECVIEEPTPAPEFTSLIVAGLIMVLAPTAAYVLVKNRKE
jgi:hypothetical protein